MLAETFLKLYNTPQRRSTSVMSVIGRNLVVGCIRPHPVLVAIALLGVLAGVGSCAHRKPDSPPEAAPSKTGGRQFAYTDPHFILGVGDEVTVTVWRHEDLGGETMVDPAGNVHLALVGPVKAAGLTPGQLANSIQGSISKFIKNPQVGVSVGSIASRKVYVLGEVNNPGSFAMLSLLTPWEAVGAAGGFTRDANRHHVLVIRQDDKGAVKTTVVSISGRTSEGELLSLTSRDIVYVPQSGISSVEDFMKRINNILQPFVTLSSAVVLGADAFRILSITGSETSGGASNPPAIAPVAVGN